MNNIHFNWLHLKFINNLIKRAEMKMPDSVSQNIKKIIVLAMSGYLMLVFFESCQKECNNRSYFLTQHQLSFLDFREGSYWIMRDSVTGITDSIVLETIHQEIWSNPTIPKGECRDYYEQKQATFKGYRDDNNIICRVRAGDNSLYMKLPGSEINSAVSFGQFPKAYTQNNITYNEVYYANYEHDPFDGHAEFTTVRLNLDSFFIQLRYFNPYKNGVLELVEAHIVK